MAYVLPGGGYEKKDLGAISEAADVACKDGKLMELAWEVNIPMPAMLEASATIRTLSGCLHCILDLLGVSGMRHGARPISPCEKLSQQSRISRAQSDVQVCTGSEETYNVASMAELLFGEATTVHNYAAHKLLSEDRTFFKQTNRNPARFQPRPQEEVQRLIAKAEAEAKVEEIPWLPPC